MLFLLTMNTFTTKEWGGCRYIRAFNIVLFKQKLLQLILWKKQVPLKKSGYNDFPQINIPFQSFANQPQTACYNMDVNKHSGLDIWIASRAPVE